MKYVMMIAAALLLGSGIGFAQEELTEKERSKLESATALEPANAAPAEGSTPALPPKPESVNPPAASLETKPVQPPIAEAPTPQALEVSAKPGSTEPLEVAVSEGPSEDAVELAPLPVAILSTVLDTCLPTLRGAQLLEAGLPAGSQSGFSEANRERFIARPQSGTYWTVPTLEGPLLVGNLDDREGACQVMGSTPLGEVVMDRLTASLGALKVPFSMSDETGADFGTPIHWRRFISEDQDYIDVLHYKGVPGSVASTIHVIVG